jgi:hypothetical protein
MLGVDDRGPIAMGQARLLRQPDVERLGSFPASTFALKGVRGAQ